MHFVLRDTPRQLSFWAMGWGHANSEAIRATTSQLTGPTPQIVIYMFSQFHSTNAKKKQYRKSHYLKICKTSLFASLNGLKLRSSLEQPGVTRG